MKICRILSGLVGWNFASGNFSGLVNKIFLKKGEQFQVDKALKWKTSEQ